MATLLITLATSAALIFGLVFFIRELWPLLPTWLALIVCILFAVAIIGSPIYSLAKWSDRRLKQDSRQDK